MTRTQALRTAATIITRQVANIDDLLLMLDGAGQTRLTAAIRSQLAERRRSSPEVGGAARPDPTLWAELPAGGGR